MASVARYLATFYLGYFGLLGVLLPYLSLYFLDIGLTPYEIGVIMAVNPLVKIVAPSLWGWLADRRGARAALIRQACGGALVAFAAMLLVRDFWLIVAVMVVYSVFTSSILPLVEATAMEAADTGSLDYGRVRLWGSVGFIVLSLGMGPVLDVLPSVVVLWTIIGLLVFNLWSVRHLPDSRVEAHGGSRSLKPLLRPQVVAFYLVCTLMQASHGMFYGFYSVYLEGLGFARGTIGLLWAVGVMAEVMALRHSSGMLTRFGTVSLMRLALMLAVVRWGILSSTAAVVWLVTAQLLHSGSFGLFHAAAVTHTHRLIPTGLRTIGQSLYSSLSYGFGLTLGLYLCGTYYEQVGAPFLFGACALVALCAMGLSVLLKKTVSEIPSA